MFPVLCPLTRTPRAQDVPGQGPSTMCVGTGRGLEGNPGLIPNEGGIPGQKVEMGTVAVIPQQFGLANGHALAPFASQINGTIGNADFSGVTDVIGGSKIGGMNRRDFLQQRYPGQLIIEVVGAPDLGSKCAGYN
jgi:hypothetical protein